MNQNGRLGSRALAEAAGTDSNWKTQTQECGCHCYRIYSHLSLAERTVTQPFKPEYKSCQHPICLCLQQVLCFHTLAEQSP